ncbi:hypothetical protein QNM34_08825 [Rahnella bonaserana]|nr:hypothetical protein [Rahnella bonaserana]WHZ42355.1 hypothetical protein QNM34_08825 [Rahnella bonaserana]
MPSGALAQHNLIYRPFSRVAEHGDDVRAMSASSALGFRRRPG